MKASRDGDLLISCHWCHHHHHLLWSSGPSSPLVPLQGCLSQEEQHLQARTAANISIHSRHGDHRALLFAQCLGVGKGDLGTPPAADTGWGTATPPAGTEWPGDAERAPSGRGRDIPQSPAGGWLEQAEGERWRTGGGRGARHGTVPSLQRVPPTPSPHTGTHWYRLLPCCRFWPSLARLGLGSLAMSRSAGREERGECWEAKGMSTPLALASWPRLSPGLRGPTPDHLQEEPKAGSRFLGKGRGSPGLCQDVEQLQQ